MALGRKLGLWKRIKRLALTDVGALVRGLKADDLEQLEQTLIEADFGVPATLDLVEFLEAEVRRGKLKTDADLRRAFADRLAEVLAGPAEPGTLAKATTGPTVVLIIGVFLVDQLRQIGVTAEMVRTGLDLAGVAW